MSSQLMVIWYLNTQKSEDGCMFQQKSFQFLKFRRYCGKNQEEEVEKTV